MSDDWEFLDAYATFLDRDSALDRATFVSPEESFVVQSGGTHPPPGQYVIDPDYMEPMGLESPDELFRYFR